jgi:hypothetical protein
MDAQAELQALTPRHTERVFDVLESLGFDMSDWIATATNPQKIKANPKYCYNWSFVAPGRLAVFNLWHDALATERGHIVYHDNFRENAEFHRRNGGKSQWVARGKKLDRDAAVAARENLPVRVLVVDGYRRATNDPSSKSSRVDRRQLDPVEWHVRSYDAKTGDFVLARGPRELPYVDQFDVAEIEPPNRHAVTTVSYQRSAEVRRSALRRADGRCEYCGHPGFTMANGRIYLETHHVVPLSEGGPDHLTNVAALCPTDHKKAHFASDRESIKAALAAKLATAKL